MRLNKLIKSTACFIAICLASIMLIGCSKKESSVIKNEETNKIIKPTEIEITESTSEYITESTAETEEETPMQNLNEAIIRNNIESYLNNLNDLSKNLTENTIYSPVSLDAALQLQSYIVEDNSIIKNYLGDIDYLNYIYNKDASSVSTLWLDSNKEYNISNIPLSVDIQYLDMTSKDATKTKNNYVSEHTNGFIDSTPTEFTKDTIVDIMNILYFKSNWIEKLYEDSNYQVFHDINNNEINIPYMLSEKGDYIYIGDISKAYKLKYTNGYEFYAVLPNDNLDTVNNADLAKDIESYISDNFQPTSGDITFKMPEIDIYNEIDLGKTNYASLLSSPISKDFYNDEVDGISINQVVKLKLDKYGTEAAAVTEVISFSTATIPEEKEQYELIFDRPFIFFIYDTQNNDILFIGTKTK